MELVKVRLFGEGYYSGATYEDNIWIKKSSYEKLKNDFPKELYCGELDGKHSETYGDVSIEDGFHTDEDYAKYGLGECDWHYLRDSLEDLYESNNLDWAAEQREVEEYFDNLDVWVDVTVSIPKSKLAKFYAYVDGLMNK